MTCCFTFCSFDATVPTEPSLQTPFCYHTAVNKMTSSNSINLGGEGDTTIPSLVPDEDEDEIEITNTGGQQHNTAASLLAVAVALGGHPSTEEWKLHKATCHLLAVQGKLPDTYKLSSTGSNTREEVKQIKQLRNFLRSCCTVHASAVQQNLIPLNAFFILVNKEKKVVIDSAEGLHPHHIDKYYLVKTDATTFYVANPHIAASLMDVFKSLDHQIVFFTAQTTPFTPNGVVHSFKNYVVSVIAAAATQVQEVLDANEDKVSEIAESIHARAANEKSLLKVEQQLATVSFDTPSAQAKAASMLQLLKGVVRDGAATEDQLAQEQQQALMQLRLQLEAASNALAALETSHATELAALEASHASERNQWIDEKHGLEESKWKLEGTTAKYDALKNSSASDARAARTTISELRTRLNSSEELIQMLRREIARLKHELRLAQGGVDENEVPN